MGNWGGMGKNLKGERTCILEISWRRVLWRGSSQELLLLRPGGGSGSGRGCLPFCLCRGQHAFDRTCRFVEGWMRVSIFVEGVRKLERMRGEI
jgi:hypothetical protein